MEVSAEKLARFVFVDNVNDIDIQLNLVGIDTSYDLFCFCVSLVMQGVNIFCGNNVEVDDIPLETINQIGRKMKNARIQMNVSVEPKKINVTNVCIMSKETVRTMSDYALFIHSKEVTYMINFTFIFLPKLPPCM